MNQAIAPIADPSSTAWARAQAARVLVRAAMNASDIVYRRTWPSKETLERLSELEVDPVLAWNGWLDSTLDLRDGLSVVEVFAPTEDAFALIGPRR